MGIVSSRAGWVARAICAFACLALPGFVYAQDAASADSKLDSAIREALQAGRSVRAIVRFKSDADRVRGWSTVSTRGGRVRRTHDDVNGLTVDVDASTVNALAYDAGVAGISIDAPVHSTAAYAREIGRAHV